MLDFALASEGPATRSSLGEGFSVLEWGMYLLLFVAEMLALFFLSRRLTQAVSQAIFGLTRSEGITVYILAFLFLPGTIVHELAHLVMAGVLLVPTHGIEFIPKLHGDTVKLGSVQVERTDPLRRFLIGAAPFVLGMSLIMGTLWYWDAHGWTHSLWPTIITGYLVFEVGNTMFSSKRDMEGALELILIISAILAVLYLLGLRLPVGMLSFMESPDFVERLTQGCLFLGVPIGLDLGVLVFGRVIGRRGR